MNNFNKFIFVLSEFGIRFNKLLEIVQTISIYKIMKDIISPLLDIGIIVDTMLS